MKRFIGTGFLLVLALVVRLGAFNKTASSVYRKSLGVVATVNWKKMKIACIVCFIVLGIGQDTGLAQKTANETPKNNAYSVEPFDIAAPHLPPFFKGHDAQNLFERLEKTRPNRAKGEYETTEAYHLRMADETSKKILGSLGYGTLYAFEIAVRRTAFDPDMQEVSIFVEEGDTRPPENSPAFESNNMSDASIFLSGMFWGQDATFKRNYVGATARGTTIPVRSVTYKTLIITFPDATFSSMEHIDDVEESSHIDDFLSDLVIKIPMQAETVKRFRKRFEVLALCQLRPPYSYVNTVRSKPTLHRPLDAELIEEHLFGELVALWVYDGPSGEVFLGGRRTTVPHKSITIKLMPESHAPRPT